MRSMPQASSPRSARQSRPEHVRADHAGHRFPSSLDIPYAVTAASPSGRQRLSAQAPVRHALHHTRCPATGASGGAQNAGRPATVS